MMTKEQRKKYNHDWYVRNKEYVKASVKLWRKNNPRKVRQYQIKTSVNKRMLNALERSKEL